ncbi:MAG TPA: membrane protein insertion efficiency factor YidD [bacterium]
MHSSWANFPSTALITAVKAYRNIRPAMMLCECRFVPSCSEYATEALRQHGALRGSWMTLRRLVRCRPFGECGYDPVK